MSIGAHGGIPEDKALCRRFRDIVYKCVQKDSYAAVFSLWQRKIPYDILIKYVGAQKNCAVSARHMYDALITAKTDSQNIWRECECIQQQRTDMRK